MLFPCGICKKSYVTKAGLRYHKTKSLHFEPGEKRPAGAEESQNGEVGPGCKDQTPHHDQNTDNEAVIPRESSAPANAEYSCETAREGFAPIAQADYGFESPREGFASMVNTDSAFDAYAMSRE